MSCLGIYRRACHHINRGSAVRAKTQIWLKRSTAFGAMRTRPIGDFSVTSRISRRNDRVNRHPVPAHLTHDVFKQIGFKEVSSGFFSASSDISAKSLTRLSLPFMPTLSKKDPATLPTNEKHEGITTMRIRSTKSSTEAPREHIRNVRSNECQRKNKLERRRRGERKAPASRRGKRVAGAKKLLKVMTARGGGACAWVLAMVARWQLRRAGRRGNRRPVTRLETLAGGASGTRRSRLR